MHTKLGTVTQTAANVLHRADGITYIVAMPTHRRGIVDVLGESFCREPMSAALNLTATQLGSLVETFLPECTTSGLSIVAVPDDEPATIAGALICRDFKGPLPDGVPEDYPWFLPIAMALGTVDQEYETKRPGLAAGDALDLWMAGVDARRFTRRGIANRLIDLATARAREHGFARCIAECTGHYSQSAVQRAGYAEAARLSYRDFRFEDKPVFAGVGPLHTHLILYEKLL
jgi:ribosomal protein S18 acetylase RimI-like enzyme